MSLKSNLMQLMSQSGDTRLEITQASPILCFAVQTQPLLATSMLAGGLMMQQNAMARHDVSIANKPLLVISS